PRAGAVPRVVLWARGVAERVVGPVVERADAGEEADRRRDEQRDEDERLPVEQRVPAAPPAEEAHEPEADAAEQRSHPERADEPRAEEQATGAAAARRSGVDVVVGCDG